MRKLLWIPTLALLAAGCGKNPVDVATGLLKAGQRDQAAQILQDVEAKHPENKTAHYLLFVLDEFQVSQGDPAKHDAYLNATISEYSWIAKDAGLDLNYQDMDGSVKSKDQSSAAYEAAYHTVFDR